LVRHTADERAGAATASGAGEIVLVSVRAASIIPSERLIDLAFDIAALHADVAEHPFVECGELGAFARAGATGATKPMMRQCAATAAVARDDRWWESDIGGADQRRR